MQLYPTLQQNYVSIIQMNSSIIIINQVCTIDKLRPYEILTVTTTCRLITNKIKLCNLNKLVPKGNMKIQNLFCL